MSLTYGQRMDASNLDAVHSSVRIIGSGLREAYRAIVHGKRNLEDYCAAVDEVSALNVKQQSSIVSNKLFRAAHCNDVDKLESECEALRPSELDQRTPAGDTAFHLAVLHDNADVALALLDKRPSLLNMVYEGKLYQGQHALHVAVVNQNIGLVKELLNRGASINKPRAVGLFFKPGSGHSHVYWGEHIISFAACTGQKDMVRLLLKKGADICVTDSQGNNILHLLVLQSDKKLALDMYEFVSSYRGEDDLEMMRNKDGFTPLQLVAYEGNYELFAYLMERRRQVHWTFGPVTSSIFSLEQLDTYNTKDSVLELIVRSKSHDAYKLLEVQPMPQLLRTKWQQFGFFYFLVWLLIYIIYLCVLTAVVYQRPLRAAYTEQCECISGKVFPRNFTSCPCPGSFPMIPFQCNQPDVQRNTNLSEAYSSSGDYWRLVGEILVILGSFVMVALEAPDLYRRGPRAYFTNIGSGIFHALSWMFCLMVWISIIMRASLADDEEVVLGLALVFGWFYLLYFLQGFAFLGPYIVMIREMIVSDISRFVVIFSVTVVSFSGALVLLFQEAKPNPENLVAESPPVEWESYGTACVTLFKLAVGISDFEVSNYEQSEHPAWVVIFLIVYLIFAFVLLINLLIAMMGSTQNRIEMEKYGVWKRQLASIIVLIETRLAKRFKVRSGFDGRLLSFFAGEECDDRAWFIRVEERDTLSSDAEDDAFELTSGDASQFPRQQPPPVVSQTLQANVDQEQKSIFRRNRPGRLFGSMDLGRSRDSVSVSATQSPIKLSPVIPHKHNFLRNSMAFMNSDRRNSLPFGRSLDVPMSAAHTGSLPHLMSGNYFGFSSSSLAPEFTIIDIHNHEEHRIDSSTEIDQSEC